MAAQNIERIDVNSEQALGTWTKKLNATPEQIRDAGAEVGDRSDDVELHLKGSRASTNSERVAAQTHGN